MVNQVKHGIRVNKPIKPLAKSQGPRPHGNYFSGTGIGSDYTDDEREFLAALDRWKIEKRVKFPSAVDILNVAISIGYRKAS